jgi:hypothetical protein
VNGQTTLATVGRDYNLNSYGGILVTLPTSTAFALFNGSTYPFVVDKFGNTTSNGITANGATNLKNLTCTTATATGLTVNGATTTQNLTATGTTSLQALTATSMTLNNIAMPTPAYLRAYLVSASVGAGTTNSLNWNVGSNLVINIPSPPSYKLVCPDIGAYLFGGKINCGSAIASTKVVSLQTSADGGFNYNIVQEWKNGSTPVGGDFVLAPYINVTVVANQIFQLKFTNDTGATFYFNSSALLTYLTIVRIA